MRARLRVGLLMLLDSVKTAKWVGDCFIYTTASNRINYFVGNESYTISPSDTYVSFLVHLVLSISSFAGHCTSLAMHPHIIASI